LFILVSYIYIKPQICIQIDRRRPPPFWLVNFWLFAWRGRGAKTRMAQISHHTSPRFLYLTRAGVECCVQAVKRCPVLRFSIFIFFGSSGSLNPTLLGDENWVPLKPVLGGMRDVALFHYTSCTDSIKRVCAIFMLFCCD
jgi:hypothetical protein